MQFNTFVTSTADLERCTQAPNLFEVLLEPALLARQGKLSRDQTHTLAHAAQQRGLKPVLVWDALMPEQLMQQICQQLLTWDLSLFSAIRVCDLGAAWWIKTQFPQHSIHLMVEAGNHNLGGLQGWCELFQDSLDRLVLSIELTEEKLIKYCQALPVGCEVLGAGQILLFYSPRSLLLPILPASDSPEILYREATVASPDSGNRPLPTLETRHGTLMFLDKDQFILDQLDPLKAAGLHTVRLDLRHLSSGKNAAENIDQIGWQTLNQPLNLRQNWPRPTRSPFFKVNRTTAIFQRIKSKGKLAEYRHQENCLAEVLSGESGQYVVFQSLGSFDLTLADHLIMPTGEVVEVPERIVFQTLNREAVTQCDRGQLLITDWIKKAVPGSLLMAKTVDGLNSDHSEP
ncbi:MAG: hypothetical protein HC835_11640 [Oscillatoriales cyanobacterium RM2_1_1]|nr:hypothetical protein [Oscillatoriales cyanobacterium SM2_3_0]NJO46225.1 hypothetical protein [Oscillatoriales cyanobacterium RM2_1_1]